MTTSLRWVVEKHCVQEPPTILSITMRSFLVFAATVSAVRWMSMISPWTFIVSAIPIVGHLVDLAVLVGAVQVHHHHHHHQVQAHRQVKILPLRNP